MKIHTRTVFKTVSIVIVLLLSPLALPQTAGGYDALVQEGKSQLRAGNSDQALAAGEKSIKLNRERWEAYALAGGALMNLKRYEEASDRFSKAIELAPSTKQSALRALRRQCVRAEDGAEASVAQTSAASQAEPAQTPLATQAEPTSTAVTQAEIVLWKTIEHSSDTQDFQSYLKQYPGGAFAVLANRHLAEQKQKVWSDPATGLMWAKQDNGGDVAWGQAKDYCAKLQLVGYSDWRLATIDELAAIYDPTIDGFCHVKGSIKPSNWVWSSTINQSLHEAWSFYFFNGKRNADDFVLGQRALCVRRSGE